MNPLRLLIWLFMYCFVVLVQAQPATSGATAPIIFIYDASGSMWGQINGTTKVEIAREVLSETIDGLDSDQRIGLVAYGHRQEGDCEDVEYLVDMSNTSKETVKIQLNAIKPLGRTPLAYSAVQVIDQLNSSSESATIILITDGIESCDGDLCAVIQKAREAGIDFRMHIVGFGIEGEDLAQLKCAAQAGNGTYYDAADAAELGAVLEEATAQTIDEPDYNLAVFTTKNGDPIDSWVRAFKAGTREELGGTRTYRDTGFTSLPAGTYDLEIRPLENSDVGAQLLTGVQISESAMTFRSVGFDAGTIGVSTLMNGAGWDATVNITYSESGKSASGGRTYGQTKFYDVDPGTFDIKLTCLRINGLDVTESIAGITVAPGDTTLIEHNFETGIARIGATSSNGLMDATVNIVEKQSGKSVGGSRTYTSESSNPKEFLLNPGDYTVTLVGVREFKGEKRTFEMSIAPGSTFEKIVMFE